MSAIPSQRVKISLTETQFGAADTQALARRLGSTVNWIIDYIDNTPPVGSIHQSSLSEADFQARKGVGWILCDGRNVAGSSYQTLFGLTNVPDTRELYLRGKNYARSGTRGDPNGDLATGTTFTGSTYVTHNHNVVFSGLNPWPVAWTSGYPVRIFDAPSGSERFYQNPFLMNVNISITNTFTFLANVEVDTEARPMSVYKNFFIRIN